MRVSNFFLYNFNQITAGLRIIEKCGEYIATRTINNGATSYFSLMGLASGNEAATSTTVSGTDADVYGIWVNITANTLDVDGTLTVRSGAADVASITLTKAVTGVISSTGLTGSLSAGDALTMEYDCSAATAGSIVINAHGVLLAVKN